MTSRIWITGLAAVALTAVICMAVVLVTAFSVSAAAETAETAEATGMETIKDATVLKLQPAAATASKIGREPETTVLPEGPGPAAKAEAAPDMLVVDTDPQMYTYDQMVLDLEHMKAKYPDLVNLDSIGDTPDGRKIWHMVIGSQTAGRHVLVISSIHAREYITTQLVMKQASEFLKQEAKDGGLLGNAAIHVVPMGNPDGVSISQLGLEGCLMEGTRQRVLEIGAMDGALDWNTYLRRWKSNAQGVDLNRNFDASWEQYNDGLGRPSADHYKGTAIGCTPETAALIRLTESYPFVRTISYHTQGDVIYWYFGQNGNIRADTERFAKRVSEVTGYPMDANYEDLDPAGYKDWAIQKKGIPSITLEVGRKISPVPPDQFPAIWQANRGVWGVILEQ